MPLPDFNQFKAVWIEKTKSSHEHGGPGWEFGSCLWSPTTNKAGQRIYENMVRAAPGDLILHFYEDTPFGKDEDHYFCGASYVARKAVIRRDPPPNPGDWHGRDGYYRVDLEQFMPFDTPLAISSFVQDRSGEIAGILNVSDDTPFVLYRGAPRLGQGNYLSRCGSQLYALLSNALGEVVQPQSTTITAQEEVPSPLDYEDYVEGQRSRRETSFFRRNPKLVRDAKSTYGHVCMACDLSYSDQYPGVGEGYIEVHHLDPLSETATVAEKPKLSRLDQVAVLCASCHRMIHRLIRRHKRRVEIAELKAHVRSSWGASR